jgi:hypothetical protein
VKVQVTLNRTEILAAIGAYLVERGVPVVAGTFRHAYPVDTQGARK